MVLEHLVFLNEQQLAEIDRLIEEKCKPYQQEMELLDTIPGVDKVSAQAILAEVGPDMSVFETQERLASWAGLSPGNNKSAGKKSTRTRPGNQYIKTITASAPMPLPTPRTLTLLLSSTASKADGDPRKQRSPRPDTLSLPSFRSLKRTVQRTWRRLPA
ncbi:MAG: IS110 family transposase [Bacillota bacterium]